MELIKRDILRCCECKAYLPHGPNPVIRFSKNSKILVIGQAPGRKVHETGIPWNDPSGDLLREWLGIDKESFYCEERIALIPMGFCYPGKGPNGDLPPRPECAPKWHTRIFSLMGSISITLLIGQYAQRYYLGDQMKKNLTETVFHYREYEPQFFPLPHPSPRNRLWMKKNPWFDKDVVPALRERISSLR